MRKFSAPAKKIFLSRSVRRILAHKKNGSNSGFCVLVFDVQNGVLFGGTL